jgi:putative peptidoglycan lipid II flippase
MSGAVLSNSFAGSSWTIVSRLTGLLKVVAVGAILGATYLGNTYQSINSLPNLVYYQLLAGSLFASLLVPPLVRHIDQEDRRGAQRLVEGFLGTLLLIAAAASVILIALGPLIMKLLTLGVHDPATAAAQQRVGWLLLAMFVPQIALYIVAGCGAAVMNADGRFALAAAAPALESAGMIAVLITAGLLFGTATGILDVSTPEVLLLGLGTTAAVGLHATCQWFGARASGLRLVPGIGWRDPELRRVLRRILPTLAFTGLAALQIFAVMIVANSVQGGFVAFQLALNFFYLPTAIVTWPIARALLPQLARLHHVGDGRGLRDEFLRGVAVASFVTVPIAVGYLVLAPAMGRALAFGALAQGDGAHLMALSLASLAPGLVAETWFILGTYALYAQHDARAPLRSMAIRVGVSLVIMVVARVVGGGSVPTLLGIALSAGSLAGAVHLWVRLRRRLPDGTFSLPRSLGRTALAAAVMAAAVFAVTIVFGHGDGHARALIEVIVGGVVGLVVFGGAQALLRAPELGWLKSSIVGRRRAATGSG